MITKTRPSEIIKTEVKEETRFDWKPIITAGVQLAFILLSMFTAHTIYISVWRMMTGH